VVQFAISVGRASSRAGSSVASPHPNCTTTKERNRISSSLCSLRSLRLNQWPTPKSVNSMANYEALTSPTFARRRQSFQPWPAAPTCRVEAMRRRKYNDDGNRMKAETARWKPVKPPAAYVWKNYSNPSSTAPSAENSKQNVQNVHIWRRCFGMLIVLMSRTLFGVPPSGGAGRVNAELQTFFAESQPLRLSAETG